MVPWNSARTRVQIKLSIQRLRSLQEKKLALAKKSRREIADLLQKGRVETARLRVEGLIQDDIYVELLELLELYAEMLQARFNLLDSSSGTEPEPSISDAVCAIVYAAPRTELKELQILREMLMHKYGRAFSLTLLPAETPPPSVPPRVASKLALYTPAAELVNAYLGEIAKGYGVAWLPPLAPSNEGDPVVDGRGGPAGDEDAPGGGAKEAPIPVAVPRERDASPNSPPQALDLPAPPAGPEKDAWAAGNTVSGVGTGGGKVNEDEELAKRFERLKNLR